MGLQRLERQLRTALERHREVVAAYLFGSAARGECKAGCNVDVGILIGADSTAAYQGLGVVLEADLASELAAPVHVAVLNQAPVDLIHRVLRYGRLLVDVDPGARIRFEVKARNEYLDLHPLLRRLPSTRGRSVPDSELLAAKLAEIETHVWELRSMGRPEEIEDDIREQRFVLFTLQLAVQACLDIASHIVSDERLGEPRTYRELFDLLPRSGWIGIDLAVSLRQMAGLRWLIVHEHAALDPSILRDIVEYRLDDLLAFVEAIRGRVGSALG